MTPKSKSKWLLLPFIALFINLNSFAQITIFEEDFSSATNNTPPTDWTNIINPGGDTDQYWVFNDTSPTITGSGFSGNYAILDSDGYGDSSTQNVTLTTIPFDASLYTNLTLSFSNYFRYYTSGESGTIEIYNGSNTTEDFAVIKMGGEWVYQ